MFMRRIGSLCIFLMLSAAAFGQNGAVEGFCTQGGVLAKTQGLSSTNQLQGVIPSCLVTVYYTGTTTQVPGSQIYSNAGGTVLGNPFKANALGSTNPGRWIFWAATGAALDVQGSGGICPNCYSTSTPLATDVFPASAGGGGGSGVQYNPSTTVYYMASSSILMNDGYSFSPGTTVGTWSCSGTTCTFNTTSAHGYTTGDYVDVSQVTGWIPDFESTRQWRTNVDIFQVTVTGTTQFTVTTSTTSTFGGSGGTSYLATYWGAYQTADQPYFKGHGTFISFFSTAQNLATNFSSEVTCSAGTPSYLILQVGANDVISNGASAATVEGYLQSIWQQAHAAGCIVVEMPILNAHVGISDWDPFWITIGQIDQWIGGQGITDAGLSAGQYWDRYVGFNGSTSGIVGVNASGSIIFASHVNEAFSTQSSSWDGNGAWQAWTNETGAYWIPGQLTMIDSFAPGGPAPAIQIQTDLIYGGTPNEGTRMFLTSYGGKDGLDQVLNPGLGQSGCSELDIAKGANQAFRVCANNVDNGSGGNDFYSIEGWTGSIWLKGIEVLTHGGLVFPQLLASSGTQPLVVDTAGNVSVGSSSGSSPLTTKGDLYGYSTTNARIPVGTNTYVLTADSTQALGLKWAPAATGSASIPTCSDTSGSGTAQSCTTSPSFTPVAGSAIVYTTTTANSGTGLTLNVNSLGAKSVAKWQSTTTLAAGDIAANKQVLMTYDGTNWETTTIGNAPSGGGGSGAMTNITGAVTVSGCTVTSGVCVVGTPGTTITLSSIPGTYNHLRLYIVGQESNSGGAFIKLNLNGDSGSDYQYGWSFASSSSEMTNFSSLSASNLLVCYFNDTSVAGASSSSTIDLPFYAQTSFYKDMAGQSSLYNASSYSSSTFYNGTWKSTAAITSATLTVTGGYNFAVGTSISIYGIQ
jgi:hypothetical protein